MSIRFVCLCGTDIETLDGQAGEAIVRMTSID